MTESIAVLNERICDILWGMPMAAFLLLGGMYLTWKTGFVQIRRFGEAIRGVFHGFFEKSEKGVTPFEAVCTALAGTVGTGNITGVAVALALGGAGAVFWMWVSSFFGMATKYAEIVLAVRFREKNHYGEFVGGPMYYIKNGLGKRFRILARIFCIFGICASFGIGNMMQMGSAAGAVKTALDAVGGAVSRRTLIPILGMGAALLTVITVMKGARGRGKLSAKVVPLMSALYIMGAAAIIVKNADILGYAVTSIFRGAFSLRAASGGTVGGMIAMSARQGLRRGIFSNEAGLGSSPIAHASSDEKIPAKQGLWGIFEVFFDTIVMCTVTAIAILTSGAEISVSDGGANTCVSAFASVFGRGASAVFLALAISLFAFSSIIGWSLYGERCAEFLFGAGAVTPYRLIFSAVVFISSITDFSFMIALSDTMNALMAFPNMAAVLALSGTVSRETRTYFGKSGKRSAT